MRFFARLGYQGTECPDKMMTFAKLRTLLYQLARIMGDIQAVRKKKVGRRLGRRVAGRLTGKMLGRFFR